MTAGAQTIGNNLAMRPLTIRQKSMWPRVQTPTRRPRPEQVLASRFSRVQITLFRLLKACIVAGNKFLSFNAVCLLKANVAFPPKNGRFNKLPLPAPDMPIYLRLTTRTHPPLRPLN